MNSAPLSPPPPNSPAGATPAPANDAGVQCPGCSSCSAEVRLLLAEVRQLLARLNPPIAYFGSAGGDCGSAVPRTLLPYGWPGNY